MDTTQLTIQERASHLEGVVLAIDDDSIEETLAPDSLDDAGGQLLQLLPQLGPHLFCPFGQLFIDQHLEQRA